MIGTAHPVAPRDQAGARLPSAALRAADPNRLSKPPNVSSSVYARAAQGSTLDRYFDEVRPGLEALERATGCALRARFERHEHAFRRRWGQPQGMSLLHGDLNPTNVLTPVGRETPLYFLDRQPFTWSLTYGVAASDLAYFMIPWWPEHTRQACEAAVLRRWYDALQAPDYSWRQAQADWRLSVQQLYRRADFGIFRGLRYKPLDSELALLRGRLHQNQARLRPARCLADRCGIVGVVLPAFAGPAVRRDQWARKQTRAQPQPPQPTRHMVRSAARPHCHQATRGQRRAPRGPALWRHRLGQDLLSPPVHRVHLEHALGQIQPYPHHFPHHRATCTLRDDCPSPLRLKFGKFSLGTSVPPQDWGNPFVVAPAVRQPQAASPSSPAHIGRWQAL